MAKNKKINLQFLQEFNRLEAACWLKYSFVKWKTRIQICSFFYLD